MKEIEGDHSLAEIGETLSKRGIRFAKSQSRLDLGTVPASIARQIVNLPAGEPFVVPSGGKLIASVITGREPVTVPPAAARSTAAEAIRRQKFMDLMQTRLKDLKDRAKVEYQPEYQPKAPAKSAPKAQKSATS